MNGQDLPDSVRMGQRLTGMSANQATLPLAGSIFKFARHGKSGAWVSELLPHTARVVDELCFIRSLYTEAINHDPAITFFQTGSQIAGRPSMGSWLSYGLGSANENLPDVLRPDQPATGRPAALFAALGQRLPALGPPGRPVPRRGRAGALPRQPAGISPAGRRKMLDRLARAAPDGIRRRRSTRRSRPGSPSTRWPTGCRPRCPEVTDLAEEPDHVFDLYGPDARQAGDVRGQLPAGPPAGRARRPVHPALSSRLGPSRRPARRASAQLCRETDQACAALIQDLKQRGMLDDTLVLWGGEFGRTNYSQGKLTPTDYGRDHHPRCFTVWAAGGGIKPGMTYGETDPFGYNIVADPVHVHDFHATVLSPPGHRPRAADLQAPGALLPPDRRRRQGGQGDPGVNPRH